MTTTTKNDLPRIDTVIPAAHRNRKGRTAAKVWRKVVDHVPEDASTGHDWSGEWVKASARIDLPIGSMLVDYDEGQPTCLRLLMPRGGWFIIDSDSSGAWAQALRRPAREWLALSPNARIVRAAHEQLAEHPSLPLTDPEYDATEESRARWLGYITEYDVVAAPAPPASPAAPPPASMGELTATVDEASHAALETSQRVAALEALVERQGDLLAGLMGRVDELSRELRDARAAWRRE